MAGLRLHCHTGFSLLVGEQRLPSACGTSHCRGSSCWGAPVLEVTASVVHRLLVAVAPLVGEHRLLR